VQIDFENIGFVIPLLTRLQQRLAAGIPHLECLNVQVHFEVPKVLAFHWFCVDVTFNVKSTPLIRLPELFQVTGLLPFLLD
jgi:hypothetical protein